MLISEALEAFLKSDVGVSGIVGNKIYPDSAPQGDPTKTLPLIVRVQETDNQEMSNDGPAGFGKAEFKLHCWALTRGGALAIAEAVRNATGGGGQATPITGYAKFEGYRGVWGSGGGVTVQGCFVGERADSQVSLQEGTDQNLYLTTLPATVWHE